LAIGLPPALIVFLALSVAVIRMFTPESAIGYFSSARVCCRYASLRRRVRVEFYRVRAGIQQSPVARQKGDESGLQLVSEALGQAQNGKGKHVPDRVSGKVPEQDRF